MYMKRPTNKFSSFLAHTMAAYSPSFVPPNSERVIAYDYAAIQ